MERLAAGGKKRTEADIQSDIQTLLTAGDLNLDTDEAVWVEEQVGDGTRRRIDIAVCHAVIEVKKDLASPAVRADAIEQLRGYVAKRREQHERRYVGVLTDGAAWLLFDILDTPNQQSSSESAGDLVQVSAFQNTGSPDDLLVWLEAILAAQDAVPPTPREIEQRLGSGSPAHVLDFRELAALYAANAERPELKLKRELWAKLLRTAFGSAFTDDDATFINHTLLVLTAETIAHAVVGLNPATSVTASDLVAGRAFAAMGIHGVVEADFFDWVIEVDGGASFIATLAARIAKFDWSLVEHDVLKHLYESVISQADRERLGEYYTPDWLADRVVADTVTAAPTAVAGAVTDPLNQRVLDPSCGSGTFLFHAVRAHLAAADAAGRTIPESVESVTSHVLGMDIHPVAVTLARVTYLLAIGVERLSHPERPELSVPVYLGDSLQWEQDPTLFSREDAFSVDTTSDHLTGTGGGMLFHNDLVFPLGVLRDAARFDALVTRMSDLALDMSGTMTKTLITPVLRQFGITDEADKKTLTETFTIMRDLARSGRDHIWGYYVRNLIRPVWLALPENKVDVLVGNPPWLRYSKMTADMKQRYKALAKPRNLLNGPLGASGRDLSTLFVVRAVEMYLNPQGRFAFVMPHGTLTRLPHTGFRSGKWASAQTGDLNVAWDISWDLTKAPTGFPMTSCVVRGTYKTPAYTMSGTVERWSSTLTTSDVTWEKAADTFTIEPLDLSMLDADIARPTSPYKKKFRQGAILVPRVLVTVENAPALPFGAGAGRRRVTSRRSSNEKKPWKTLPSITEPVETGHIYPVYLGESIAHYRALDPIEAVLPLGTDRLMTEAEIAEAPGLATWWNQAETMWAANKVANDPSDLLTRIDYLGQLSSQRPPAAHRVVYTKSGSNLAAARVENTRAVIDHKLYWAPVTTTAEGQYLVGILNSNVLLDRVRPLQNVGLFGPRDFDKNVFYVPFPPYDADNPTHRNLVNAVAEAEALAATVTVAASFKTTRRSIKRALLDAGLHDRLEAAVDAVLPKIQA